jgi:hypothetical protein
MLAREQSAGRFRHDLDAPLAITLILGVLGQTARSVHFNDSVLDVADYTRRLAQLLSHGLACPDTYL